MAAPPAAVKYSSDEDHILMNEVVLYNPFQKGHSWEGLKRNIKHKAFVKRSSKSLRDRTFLLLENRRTAVMEQENASGSDEPPSSFDTACDEALLMKAGVEDVVPKRKRDSVVADIRQQEEEAEMRRRYEFEEKERRKRDEFEEKERRKRQEFDLLRADAAEDRQLRREELALRDRELALREKQEEENSKERQLMIQLLMQFTKNKAKD